MHQLSIIVPLLGHPASFEETLVSVLENRPRRAEVILACSADYTDPYGLEGEVRVVRIDGPANWVHFANEATRVAQSEMIHWLWPGARVEEGWNDSAMEMLRFDTELASVAPIIVADGARWAGVTYVAPGRRILQRCDRCRLTGDERLRIDGPSYLAGWYRRDALFALGGWDRAIGPAMADVDLALRLKSEGHQCQMSVASLIEFPGPIENLPMVGGYELGRCSQRMVRRHAQSLGWHLGPLATPRTLMADLFRWPPVLGALAFWSGRAAAILQRDVANPAWEALPYEGQMPATGRVETDATQPADDGQWDGDEYTRRDHAHVVSPPRNKRRASHRESERR